MQRLGRPWAWCAVASFAVGCLAPPAWAGGGLVLRNDVCIMTIGFYEAHFTAYQPATRGNEEFCKELPDLGETLFVLDYLHASMKEVPIDFRIIRDATGLGPFAQPADVDALGALDDYTVFYQPPIVRVDASLQVRYDFVEPGPYIGIVTAGHPTKDTVYTSVFPLTVGVTDYTVFMPFVLLALALPFGYYFVRRNRHPASVEA